MNQHEIDKAKEKCEQEIADFNALLQHPAWKKLEYLLKSQVLTRQNEAAVAASTGTQDGQVKATVMLNEVQGIKLALAMPRLLIEDINTQLAKLEDEEHESTG